jgi:hypothetical protein
VKHLFPRMPTGAATAASIQQAVRAVISPSALLGFDVGREGLACQRGSRPRISPEGDLTQPRSPSRRGGSQRFGGGEASRVSSGLGADPGAEPP